MTAPVSAPRRRFARLALPLALAGTQLWSMPARAQSDDLTSAESLFREARTALQQNDLARACEKFEESERLDPSLGTMLNLSVCEERRGRIAHALSWAVRFLHDASANDDRRAVTEQRRTALVPRVPRIVVRLERPLNHDMQVVLDEKVLGTAQLQAPIEVDPGDHVVRVEPSGPAVKVHVNESELLPVLLRPPEAVALAPPPSDRGVHDGIEQQRPRWLAGQVLVGVGSAAALVGLTTGALAWADKRTMDAHCRAGRCDATGLTASDRGGALAVVSTVSCSAAIASLSTGLYLAFRFRPKRADAVILSMIPLSDGAGLSVSGPLR